MQATFFKGGYQQRDLYCWPPKNGPNLAGVSTGSALLILKGVFGLNVALRMWCTKASRVLVAIRFYKERVCRGMFPLHDPSVFVWPDLLTCRRHVGQWRFAFRCQDGGCEQKLSQRFDHCARQYEEHADGEITVSMKLYVQRQRFPKMETV